MLRIFNLDDAAFVLALLNEPGWIQYIGDRGVRNIADAQSWIQQGPLASQAKSGFSFYVVTLRESGLAIGICGLIKRDKLKHIDLGYAFLSAYNGYGYALEAATATMQYAHQTLQIQQLAAITLPDNHASNRLLGKLGFALEQVLVFDGEDKQTNLWAYVFPAKES